MDDAGNGATRGGAQREDGPAAALGHEVVLQMVAQGRVARERAEPIAEPRPALAELAPESAQGRRGRVTEIRAVVLDGLPYRAGDGCEARLDALRERPERRWAAGAVERRARAEPGGDRRRHRVQRGRVEDAAAGRELDRGPDVACAGEVGLGRLLEHRDRLGGQDVTSNDLVGVGRRRQCAGQVAPGLARRGRREALEDRGELQELEGPWIHRGSVGPAVERDRTRRGRSRMCPTPCRTPDAPRAARKAALSPR